MDSSADGARGEVIITKAVSWASRQVWRLPSVVSKRGSLGRFAGGELIRPLVSRLGSGSSSSPHRIRLMALIRQFVNRGNQCRVTAGWEPQSASQMRIQT